MTKLLEPVHQIAWKTTSELYNVHVKDVVTDWSFALSLARFLVSTLFGSSEEISVVKLHTGE